MSDNVYDAGSSSTPDSALELSDFLDILGEAGTAITENLGAFAPIMGVSFVLALLNLGVSFAIQFGIAYDPDLQLPLTLASYASSLFVGMVSTYLMVGVYRMVLAYRRSETVDIALLNRSPIGTLKVMVGQFFYGVVMVLACFLLVLPGIFVWIALLPMAVLLADDDHAGMEVIGQAFELTEGYRLYLLVQQIIIVIGVVVLSCMTCGLSQVVATPYMAAVHALTVEKLRNAQLAK